MYQSTSTLQRDAITLDRRDQEARIIARDKKVEAVAHLQKSPLAQNSNIYDQTEATPQEKHTQREKLIAWIFYLIESFYIHHIYSPPIHTNMLCGCCKSCASV